MLPRCQVTVGCALLLMSQQAWKSRGPGFSARLCEDCDAVRSIGKLLQDVGVRTVGIKDIPGPPKYPLKGSNISH